MEDQRQKNASASTSITRLPREILVKILTGLPAKSAVRFRCSCKFFYSYIPKPRFGFRIVVVLPSSVRSVLSLNSLSYNEESHGRLQADSAQVLDLRGLRWADSTSSADGKMVLLNNKLWGDQALFDISTGRRISVPSDSSLSYVSSVFTVDVVAFDSVSERYKVFRSSPLYENYRWVLNRYWVLTVDVDESWREIEFTTGHLYVAMVHINGIIYFIPDMSEWSPDDINELSSSPKIAAMDVATESFITFVPFPSGYHPYPHGYVLWWVPWIMKLNGRMSFINFIIPDAREDERKIEIWTWERSMEEWEKQTILLPLEESKVISQASSMGFATNSMGEIVFLLQSNTMSPLILVYSFGRDVWKRFEISGVSNYKLHLSSMKSLVHVEDEIAYFLE
ncbi:PREDICTED: putative F-box protein At2g16220 [Ipomoea nil]|uniref:putative F-box protein At2g16220 n=1 Tax=Ipomoea nil TaxID=35883 RepID=UPI000900E561|nr:PREDICTED: putative F-box protein At2g16220 [Ipomoea nil]